MEAIMLFQIGGMNVRISDDLRRLGFDNLLHELIDGPDPVKQYLFNVVKVGQIEIQVSEGKYSVEIVWKMIFVMKVFCRKRSKKILVEKAHFWKKEENLTPDAIDPDRLSLDRQPGRSRQAARELALQPIHRWGFEG